MSEPFPPSLILNRPVISEQQIGLWSVRLLSGEWLPYIVEYFIHASPLYNACSYPTRSLADKGYLSAKKYCSNSRWGA